MKWNKWKYTLAILMWLVTARSNAQHYEASWQSLNKRPVPAWFEDAKFGVFIHWGVFSVPAYSPSKKDSVKIYDRYAEHYWRRWKEPGETQHYFIDFHNRVYGPNKTYNDFADDFKAEMFDPDAWARLFKSSGAKYVVLTSKHHEGFTLWPSAYSPHWNAVERGPHQDLLGNLTKAVRNQGLKMGYYYSLLEWYNPLYKKATINQYVTAHMLPQMKELISAYKPDIFWADGEWDYNSADLKSTAFLQWLYNDSPVKSTVVVNDRWGKETRGIDGGYYTTEYDMAGEDKKAGPIINHPWEECRGMAGSFGYNRNESLEDYSSSADLIQVLIDKVSRGGNLLLNIGPTADGRIPVIMQERLTDIGDWLKINGEAIYGTRKWKNAPPSSLQSTTHFTQKGDNLYVILTQWPDAPLFISNIKRVSAVSLLGSTQKVKYKLTGNILKLIPPVITPANYTGKYAWVFKLSNIKTIKL